MSTRSHFGKMLMGGGLVLWGSVLLNLWPYTVGYMVAAAVVPLIVLGFFWEAIK